MKEAAFEVVHAFLDSYVLNADPKHENELNMIRKGEWILPIQSYFPILKIQDSYFLAPIYPIREPLLYPLHKPLGDLLLCLKSLRLLFHAREKEEMMKKLMSEGIIRETGKRVEDPDLWW